MMFTMSDIIEKQTEFQRIYVRKKYHKELEELTETEISEIIKQQVLSLGSEVFEFLDRATNWKDHRAPATLDRHAMLEEHVDIGNYWLNLFVYGKITSHEYLRVFAEKHETILKRWKEEMEDK